MLYREALVRIKVAFVGKMLGILRTIVGLINRRLVFCQFWLASFGTPVVEPLQWKLRCDTHWIDF